MHELIKGLQGVEVVADDFVVVGLGETTESAVRNHDDNLQGFLQRCEERRVKLNARKARLRMSEVPFIGHVETPEGLCVDPAKVRAIKEMPPPVDIVEGGRNRAICSRRCDTLQLFGTFLRTELAMPLLLSRLGHPHFFAFFCLPPLHWAMNLLHTSQSTSTC